MEIISNIMENTYSKWKYNTFLMQNNMRIAFSEYFLNIQKIEKQNHVTTEPNFSQSYMNIAF